MAFSALAVRTSKDAGNLEQLMSIFANLYNAETKPDGYINLGTAENALMSDVLIKHMHDNLKIPRTALTYGDGFQSLKAAAARFLTRHLRPVTPIQPTHLSISNGVTAAIENLAWAIGNPGDGVLLGRPYYRAFPSDLNRRAGLETLPVSFGDVDPMGPEAVDRYEAVVSEAEKRGQRVVGLILAHPHNPLGKCYPRDTLIGLMKLCQKHQIHLISDEIYALSVFENKVDSDAAVVPFESILSIDPEGIIDPALVHVLWGMSKDFGANGLRVGITISQHSPGMRTALMSVFEFTSASSLSDLVTTNAISDDEWVEGYIAENQRRLSQQQEQILRWAQENGIEYVGGSNAGFFVWVNLGHVYKTHHPSEDIDDLDEAIGQALLEHKVLVSGGVGCASEKPGWARIVFTQQSDYLDEGLRRITAALKGKE